MNLTRYAMMYQKQGIVIRNMLINQLLLWTESGGA